MTYFAKKLPPPFPPSDPRPLHSRTGKAKKTRRPPPQHNHHATTLFCKNETAATFDHASVWIRVNQDLPVDSSVRLDDGKHGGLVHLLLAAAPRVHNMRRDRPY